MPYNDKIIELLKSKELTQEQIKKLKEVFPELKDEDEMIKDDITVVLANSDFLSRVSSSFADMLIWLNKHVYTQKDLDDAYLNGVTNTKRELAKQKPTEWSKEDEAFYQRLEQIVYKVDFETLQGDIDLHSWLKDLKDIVIPQKQWKVVDKEIYVKEPALAQRKDKSAPNHGYVICYDHTLTPDVYERFIMISDIYNQSHWKPSEEQIMALRWVLNNVPYNKHKEEISGLIEQIKDFV